MQCPDCDAKDQVTIAGKTFCANCGTPTPSSSQAAPTSSGNQNSSNTNVTQPDTTQITPPASLPTAPIMPTLQSNPALATNPVTNPNQNTFSRFQTPVALPNQPTSQPVATTPHSTTT